MSTAEVEAPPPSDAPGSGDQKKDKTERADRTALALRNTGIALCSVYPSPHVYLFFQDVFGKIRLMNWDCVNDWASKEFPGPGSVAGVLQEADNARWSTPLAAVAYQSVRRYCCARESKSKPADKKSDAINEPRTIHSAACDRHTAINKAMDTVS